MGKSIKKNKAHEIKDLNEVKPVSKTVDCTTEKYDPDKGPSSSAFKTSEEMLFMLKNAFKAIFEKEREKEDFSEDKFIFEFARNIPGILKLRYPEIEDIYVKPAELSEKQKILTNSFMNTCCGIPLSMMLMEWYNTEYPEKLSKGYVPDKINGQTVN